MAAGRQETPNRYDWIRGGRPDPTTLRNPGPSQLKRSGEAAPASSPLIDPQGPRRQLGQVQTHFTGEDVVGAHLEPELPAPSSCPPSGIYTAWTPPTRS